MLHAPAVPFIQMYTIIQVSHIPSLEDLSLSAQTNYLRYVRDKGKSDGSCWTLAKSCINYALRPVETLEW